MSSVRAWVYCNSESADFKARLANSLLSKGISTTNCEDSTDGDLGIVLFEEVESSHLATVRNASNCAGAPIYAICTRTQETAHHCWQLLKAGAEDVIYGATHQVAAELLAAQAFRRQRINALMKADPIAKQCVGESRAWNRCLYRTIDLAVHGTGPALIIGESGTGKEVASRLIHELDPRTEKGPLVVLDCSTIARDLSGSEFFGHVKGAFTGAITEREGAFSLADGGTLFLDEVGELPLRLQPELLRVIQEGVFKAVGSNLWKRTSFRLISATNRELEREVENARFRHDLFYRLASNVIRVPPLRERVEDILVLARRFLEDALGEKTPPISIEVAMYLVSRNYPGNVRQLKGLVHHMVGRYSGVGPLTLGLIPREEWPEDEEDCSSPIEAFEKAIATVLSTGLPLKEISRLAEDTAVRLAIQSSNGSLQKAAHLLSVSDRSLQLRTAAWRTTKANGVSASNSGS
jgi:transcriptional regulator with GAF, ATPase, and Fis domain